MSQQLKHTSSKELPFHLEEDNNGKLKCIPQLPDDTTSLLGHLKKLMGTANDDLTLEVIAAASGGMSVKADRKHLLTIAAGILAECQPQDLHEARLCLQSHNLFYQGMYYLDQAQKADKLPQAEFYMKSALKLIRLHTETVEAINRYKRKGEQKVVVQHVHVVQGGQAIVGTIETRGRGYEKSSEVPHE